MARYTTGLAKTSPFYFYITNLKVSTILCESCGDEIESDGFYFYRGKFEKKCKKCRRQRMKDIYTSKPYYNWARTTKRYHELKGYKVFMSVEELETAARLHSHCMICGKELQYGRKEDGKVQRNSPTLDRINCEDYIYSNNCMILCPRCNASKQDMTMSEFVEYCRNVVKKFGKVDKNV